MNLLTLRLPRILVAEMLSTSLSSLLKIDHDLHELFLFHVFVCVCMFSFFSASGRRLKNLHSKSRLIT